MQHSPAWKSDYAFQPLEEPESHFEESEVPADASTAWGPNIATLVERFNEPPSTGPGRAPASPPLTVAQPRRDVAPPRLENGPVRATAQTRFGMARFRELGLPLGTLLPGLVGLAVVPMSFLFFLWWQDTTPRDAEPVQELTVTRAPSVAAPEQEASVPKVALSSPDRLEADAGRTIAFPIAIGKAEALPERSLIAVSALPQGASFSQGRPYGDTGWSLRPDETAGLQLQLPAQSGASNLRVELISGEGTVLAQSTTELSITPPQVATADTVVPTPPVETAQMEQATGATADEIAPAEAPATATTALRGSLAETEPVQQEAAPSAAGEPDVTVNTVKTVAVAPPRETKPYDGAMALGSPADVAQATDEWMETTTAVDMHARAEQKSETVKVAQGGLKMRVTGRDKNWIQVNDPKSGTTGWIYNRFLKAADAPAQ